MVAMTNRTTNCSYEEAVRRLRAAPSNARLIEQCYLDEDVPVAARRFAASDEFQQTMRLLRLHRDNHKRTIVDLGCGNGIAAYAFAALGHRVIAVDPDSSSEVGLGAARRLAAYVAPKTLEFVHASSEVLPFDNATVDIVYARQALHHFQDLTRGVRECARVLKKGGLLLAAREHVISRVEDLKTFLESHALHRFHGAENAYLLESYLAAFKIAGLRVRQCLGPWDSPITAFPMTSSDIRRKFMASLGWGFKAKILWIFMVVPGGEQWVRRFFSRNDHQPGRLYAFLCEK